MAICLVGGNYRVDVGSVSYLVTVLGVLVLIGLNAFAHWYIRGDRSVSTPWLVVLGALDLALISLFVCYLGGFESNYFILYYLALAALAAATPGIWLGFAMATAVAAAYFLFAIYFGAGIEFNGQDEEALFIRIVALFAVVALVYLILRFERTRGTVNLNRERDRALHRQRAELSQAIHDTTAQSAYMIGLGLETAIELADKSNRLLVENLQATYMLSKSTLWELRHPIDIGLIFEGRELANVLQAHASTFTSITSVPAEVFINGKEPPLSTSTKSGLFSIAHNAMTNAYRHAFASSVAISLDFGTDHVRMSVSDDGIGLPDNYAQRGHGFRNMRASAESIGGRLEVRTGGTDRGTVISCLIPHDADPGG